MVYPRISKCGLPPPEIAQISAAFEEVCRILRLTAREDALCDIVADIVIDCIKRGIQEPKEIVNCAEEALRHAD
jgi:hypothetical protein